MYYKGVDKMFNKLYEKFKNFMSENLKTIIVFLLLYLVLTIPLPYYVYAGGGTIDISNRVDVKSSKKNKINGKMYFAYVRELKGNPATYLLSKIMKDWDLEKEEDVTLTDDETMEDVTFRDRIYLKSANQNAILQAYQKAGKKVTIKASHPYVLYVTEKEENGIRVGDEIVSVENEKYTNVDDFKKIINAKEVGDKINLLVKRDNKEKKVTVTIKDNKGVKQAGVSIMMIYDYDTNPKIELKFKQSESGPSGGLMLTLAIYNNLTKKDITNGKKIVGTGTIEEDGSVGSIGGVKYKLNGAVRQKADVFLVPAGENYEEAMKEKKRKGYSIRIEAVATFDDALKVLEKLS